jgi:hypothetical protein
LIALDFNHDGLLDLATLEERFDRVVVLLNDGGRFTRSVPLKFQTGNEPGSALVADDFNGDTILDLVVGNQQSRDLSLLLGREDAASPGRWDGNFAEHRLAAHHGPPATLRVDLNGDGRPDVAQIDESKGEVSVRLHPGGEEAAQVEYVPGSVLINVGRTDPLHVDINGDGAEDVVTVSGGGSILTRLARSTTEARFDSPVRLFGEARVHDVAAVRISGGIAIAATNRRDNSVSLFRRDAAGIWTAHASLETGRGPTNLVVGDISGDGRDDLLVVNALSLDVSVFTQEAGGNFAPATTLTIGEAAAELVLEDFLGDDKIDLAVAKPLSGTIAVWKGLGGGKFERAVNFKAGKGLYGLTKAGIRSLQETSSLAVGNLNGDGRADLVAANTLANSFGLFTGKHDGAGMGASLLGPTVVQRRVSPDFVVTADFNGDEFDDIAAVYRAENEIGILLNDGTGNFNEEARFLAGSAIVGLTAGDANGDRKLDLLVNNQFGDLLVLLGDGSGEFESYRRADAGTHLAVADVNADGKPDFIFADGSRDRLRVETNDGSERFNQQSNGILAPGTVHAADMDRDGLVDLVVPNGGGNSVLVYPGRGDGGFDSPIEKHTGVNPSHVSISDLSGDGILDVVVANKGSNDVTVLLGTTGGPNASWGLINGPRLDLRAGGSQAAAPVHSFIKDVTGRGGALDGIGDLIITNQISKDVYLVPGLGGGFFDDERAVRFGADSELIESYVDNAGDLIAVGTTSISRFTRFDPARRLTTPLAADSRVVSSVGGDFDLNGQFDLVFAEASGFVSHYTFGVEGLRLIAQSAYSALGFFADLAIVQSVGQTVIVGVGADSEGVVPVLTFSAVPRLVFTAAAILLPALNVRYVPGNKSHLPVLPIPEFDTSVGAIMSDSTPSETRSSGLSQRVRWRDALPDTGSAPSTVGPPDRPKGDSANSAEPPPSVDEAPDPPAASVQDEIFLNWPFERRRGSRDRPKGDRRVRNRIERPSRMIQTDDLMTPQRPGGEATRRPASETPAKESDGDTATAPDTLIPTLDAHRERPDTAPAPENRRAEAAIDAARLVAIATFVYATPRIRKRPKKAQQDAA